MNALNAGSQSHSTSSTKGSTSLRSRRLISIVDDESGDESNAQAQSVSPFLSPFGSRAASPIPSKHPSRSSSVKPIPKSSVAEPRRRNNWNAKDTNDLSTQFNGLWGNSWSALQGLASGVLGSDLSVKDKLAQRSRRPREATHSPVRTGTAPSKWGPSAPGSPLLGAGSQEERQALVRAKKREELLMGNGTAYADNNPARYKRRNSDDFESMSMPPAESDDRDAKIYIHHVKPEDTLAGISIKFGCPLTVLKKSNRMWANDTVQSRKTVVLPVDECTIKGRPVDWPTEDLLLDGAAAAAAAEQERERTPVSGKPGEWLDKPQQRRGSTSTIKRAVSPETPTQTTTASTLINSAASITSNTTTASSDPPWTHDSWIILDHHTTAIEIARLPRRDLGFFPRTRRKSTCCSDGGGTPTSLAMPSISLDLPRLTTGHPSDYHADPSTMPGNTTNPRRHTRRQSSTSFAALMHGPGGVGRLVGRSPVRGPGPAEDPLNKLFAPHLPSVAPPTTPRAPSPLRAAARASFESDGYAGSSGGYAGAAGGGLAGLESMGGAIEGWMRKFARRVSEAPLSPMLSPRRTGNGGGGSGAASGQGVGAGQGVGDLIELSDTMSDYGDREAEDVVGDAGLGRGGAGRVRGASGSSIALGEEWERGRRRSNTLEEDREPTVLRERFTSAGKKKGD